MYQFYTNYMICFYFTISWSIVLSKKPCITKKYSLKLCCHLYYDNLECFFCWKLNQNTNLFSFVPHSDVSHELLGSGGQTQVEGEAEHTVHVPQEVQSSRDLTLDLQTTTWGQIKHWYWVSLGGWSVYAWYLKSV